tara:strand:- start:246 stop:1376 length:1131 start_codon:yes stop_codon:yes gene_type:complete
MKYCQRCLTPDTRPRIVFNDGVCNACLYAEELNKNEKINYSQRGIELENLVERIKKYSHKYELPYDCILPWSGGKDSSSIAIKLKDEYKLRPLLVRFNALIPTPVGIHNCNELLSYGFDSIEIKPNFKVSKLLSLRFLSERGNPKLHWDAAVSSALYKTSITTKIPFIFYAEHGETLYGGRVLKEDSEKMRDYEEVIENQIGDNPENWIQEDISLEDLYPYIMPMPNILAENLIEAHYFGYYREWNVADNFRYISSKIDFKTTERGRTYGTFTNYDSLDDYMDDMYYYMNYIKFGYGRCIRDLSRHIQKGEISRSEALKLAKKYDGEYPEESIPHILNYLNIDETELIKIIDSHRLSSIWEKKNSEWVNKLEKNLM